MENFYGYTEVLEDLLKLKEKYGSKICVKTAGTSVMGRIIPLVKTGRGDKKLLIAASVHSREFISSCFIMRCLKEFLKQDCELEDKSLYIIPMLNPDGVEIALKREEPIKKPKNFTPELFKNNADNINLNANFPFCFNKVPKSRQGGCRACSEPETKALVNLCEEEKFSAAVALHARGNCIYFRDFGNGRVKGDCELACAFKENCGFALVEPTKNAEDYAGGFENWFRFRYKKPALCVELVEDENISFQDMCKNFEEAVNWDKTRDFLKTFVCFS
ncbi:MAG: hypothetical protein IJ346_06395 [Clostridia bacterium]|nr:hypothetical protein [Clostridia bacterium]